VIILTEAKDIQFLTEIKRVSPKIQYFSCLHQSLKPQELMPMMKVGITALIEYTVFRVGHVRVDHSKISSATISATKNAASISASTPIISKGDGGYLRPDLKPIPEWRTARHQARAAQPSNSRTPSRRALLNINNVYDPLQVQLRGWRSDSRQTRRTKGRNAGFKFEKSKKKEMRKLAGYVYMRVMEQSKQFIDNMLEKK
jgi:hypothetical protein